MENINLILFLCTFLEPSIDSSNEQYVLLQDAEQFVLNDSCNDLYLEAVRLVKVIHPGVLGSGG